MEKLDTIYKGVNPDTKEFFISLSKQTKAYHSNDNISEMLEKNIPLNVIKRKFKCYPLPINIIDVRKRNKKFYDNIDNCINLLELFCKAVNGSIKDITGSKRNENIMSLKMAFTWCAFRDGFNKEVICVAINKKRHCIDHYMSRMDDIRFRDHCINEKSNEFKIVDKYEKRI